MGHVLCCGVCGDFEISEFPLCGGSTLRCEDFDFFKFTCVWALCCAVVCVETLRFFKIPPCVGPKIWCVRTLSFQSPPVCGPCDVVCEDLEFQSSPVSVSSVL